MNPMTVRYAVRALGRSAHGILTGIQIWEWPYYPTYYRRWRDYRESPEHPSARGRQQ